MKQQLLIFDFDGTLFDTVPANCAAYNAALAPYGVSLTEEVFARDYNGKHYRQFLPQLLHGDAAAAEEVHREKVACYPQFHHRIRENAALFRLIGLLRDRCYIALVSTATRKSIMQILTRFGRADCFDLILTQEDALAQKPAPDSFLQAMAHFGVGPAQTLIFEDAPTGIAAAKAAHTAYLVVKDILPQDADHS